jgi:hypothetical protein
MEQGSKATTSPGAQAGNVSATETIQNDAELDTLDELAKSRDFEDEMKALEDSGEDTAELRAWLDHDVGITADGRPVIQSHREIAQAQRSALAIMTARDASHSAALFGPFESGGCDASINGPRTPTDPPFRRRSRCVASVFANAGASQERRRRRPAGRPNIVAQQARTCMIACGFGFSAGYRAALF